jgi:hypothetical protein
MPAEAGETSAGIIEICLVAITLSEAAQIGLHVTEVHIAKIARSAKAFFSLYLNNIYASSFCIGASLRKCGLASHVVTGQGMELHLWHRKL